MALVKDEDAVKALAATPRDELGQARVFHAGLRGDEARVRDEDDAARVLGGKVAVGLRAQVDNGEF